MIIGDEVIVRGTGQRARVLSIHDRDVKIKIYGADKPLFISRYLLRVPSAHDRDRGAVRAQGGFFIGACLAALLIYAAMHMGHKADTPVTPTPSATIDFDHAQGYVSLPDCASADMPCVSDDETPGQLAMHTRDAKPVPFIANGAPWTDTDGRVMHSGVIDGGTIVDVCPANVACVKLSVSFDGAQRYWMLEV